MIIAIDFDGTIVSQDRPYEDTTTPLAFLPGAREGLVALKRAGNVLVLWSGRASRALMEDPRLDPLVRAGVRRIDAGRWSASQALNRERHAQMLAFVEAELPGVFDAIDDGQAGKLSVDLFIDDRALRFGQGGASMGWAGITRSWGEPEEPTATDEQAA